MASVSQPSPLRVARQRAQALLGSADFLGARDVLEHAVDFGKSTLGEDDPDVLATLHQLARLHLRADDPAAARRFLEEAYAAGQWRLGDTDPLMLEISFDLGLVAEELGNRHEARKAFTRVAGVGADVLGADHWAVVRARAYLGGDPPATAEVDPTQDPTAYADQQPPSPPLTPSAPPMGIPQQRPVPQQQTPQQPPTPQQRPTPQHPPIPQRMLAGPDPDTTRQPAAYHSALTEPTVVQLPIQPHPAPAPPVAHIVPTRPARAAPLIHGSEGPPYRKRGVALFAAIAASVAAVIAVVALVFVLANRGAKSDNNVPTLGGSPPTDVRLIDKGSVIDVTWRDPANGKTTFLVMMAHPNEVLKPVIQVGPGRTSYELTGLSTKLDYCFEVVAAYGTNTFAKSPLICTSRAGGK